MHVRHQKISPNQQTGDLSFKKTLTQDFGPEHVKAFFTVA
jgi:hypothetical protein